MLTPKRTRRRRHRLESATAKHDRHKARRPCPIVPRAMPRPALRVALARRDLATAAPIPRKAIIGARIDTSTRYTDTGGSGLDSTAPSRDAAHRAARVRALYHSALRGIPDARVNFTIVEDARFLRDMVRDLFESRKGVTDGKVADMLVFKGVQEVEEVKMQFKSRTYLQTMATQFREKKEREAALEKGATAAEDDRMAMLAGWKARGLVPAEVLTWPQYERWKADENSAFAQFAVDGGLFDQETLDLNQKVKSQCAMM